MKNFVCGCDVGVSYGKAVIMDLDGKILGSSIVSSKIDPEETYKITVSEVMKNIESISNINDFAYLVGTGYGVSPMPLSGENISDISCHAMGVHITNPAIQTIVDIGGLNLKSIVINENGTVKDFRMNEKCNAGIGRGKLFENIAHAFDISLEELSKMSLQATRITPITSQCSMHAEAEILSLIADESPFDIIAGIQASVAKKCFTMMKIVGIKPEVAITGGCGKNIGLKKELEKAVKFKITDLDTDPQLMGALGACEFARQKALSKVG